MKIDKKDAKLLLYTVGILTFILVYFLVYKPVQENNEVVEAENEQLSKELGIRRIHASQMESYKKETDSMQVKIGEALDRFPAAVKEEDILMYGDMLEKRTDMKVVGINVEAENQIYELGQGVTMLDEEGNPIPVNTQIFLNQRQAVYTFTVSYDDFKTCIKTIQNEKEKRNVENMTVSFDSGTGKLVGSMNVSLYAVSGTDRNYTAPKVQGMPLGTDNIFGTVSSQSGETKAAEDDAESGEGNGDTQGEDGEEKR